MKRFLIVVATLSLIAPGIILAQDELTLEGLSEQLTAVAE